MVAIHSHLILSPLSQYYTTSVSALVGEEYHSTHFILWCHVGQQYYYYYYYYYYYFY